MTDKPCFMCGQVHEGACPVATKIEERALREESEGKRCSICGAVHQGMLKNWPKADWPRLMKAYKLRTPDNEKW